MQNNLLNVQLSQNSSAHKCRNIGNKANRSTVLIKTEYAQRLTKRLSVSMKLVSYIKLEMFIHVENKEKINHLITFTRSLFGNVQLLASY